MKWFLLLLAIAALALVANPTIAEADDTVFVPMVTQPACPSCDRAALVALYNGTDGFQWDRTSGWLDESVPHCSWYGVHCAVGGVDWIDLRINHLRGKIPPEFGDLTSLTDLILLGNQLATLPDSFGNLNSLTGLSLSENLLSTVPDSFGNLTNLTSLYLYSNQLSTLPDSFGNLSSVIWLDLHDNELITLPGSFGNLTNLQYLHLNGN